MKIKLQEMSFDEYRAIPAISASMIKLAAKKTKAHVYHSFFEQDQDSSKSAAMALGSVVHKAILEPETFDDYYVVMPEGLKRNTKEGKALWADLTATGKEPIPRTEWNKAKAIAKQIHAMPYWDEIMQSNPVFENVLTFIDDGGVFKARFDIYCESTPRHPNGLIVDLKTCADADNFVFARSCHNLGYHIQAAFYTQMVKQSRGGESAPDFLILAVETKAPFLAAPYLMDAQTIKLGQDDCARLIPELKNCFATNQWTGYSTEPEYLSYPAYAFRDDEIIFDDDNNKEGNDNE
jgi:exodeoxyribonuclease VIII